MKKILSIFIVVFCTTQIFAQKRNLEQAKHLAHDYLEHNKCIPSNGFSNKTLVNNASETINKIAGIDRDCAPFYILKDSIEPTSYIIISGDERMKTVLAYGENGKWEDDDIPDGLLFLLENYRHQYELLQSGNVTLNETPIDIFIPNIEPLMQTTWRQDYPFNELCPNDCPSGCVATAMSQVMKYHQYPSSGLGNFAYTSHTRKYRCSYDFSSVFFDWSQMKDSYGKSNFDIGNTEIDAIAQITYACGVSVGMDYDKSGSGAYMSDVPYALIHFFGYNDNVSFRDRTYYDATEWYQMLCSELSAGRPVIYGGVDSRNGGHAFVIDGCSSESRKFHINWGWDGNFDDYYELDALDPQSYKFSSYQDMVINVSPDLVGSFEDVFYADNFSVSSKIALDKNIIFNISDVYCYSSQSSYAVSKAKFYGRIGVGVFDKDFNFISSIGSDSIEGLNNFYGYTKLTYHAKIQQSLFPEDGVYYIAPYVKEKGSQQPSRIRTTGGKTDFILVSVENGEINGEGENENPVEVVSEWSEDFESGIIPKSWKQEVELGISKWKARYVLMSSDEMPAAAHGKGYVYLDHATGLDLYNSRSVTRLVSPIISLINEKEYSLSFHYRKLSSQPESTDILTVYFNDGKEWNSLSEVTVINQSEWRQHSVELPVLENLQLAFEGSPSKESTIFLDDIRIYERKNESSSIIDYQAFSCNSLYKIYNLSGYLIKETHISDLKDLRLPQGVYILRGLDKTLKIHIK